MLKKLLLPFILAALLISVFPAYANDQLVYGPATVAIGRWYVHLSFHRFQADSSDKGFLTIVKNTPDLKIRGGFLLFNGGLITLRDFLNGSNTRLNRDVPLQSRNRFIVFLRGAPGASLTFKISTKSLTPPPEVNFSVFPASIISGESTTLTWDTSHAGSCVIEPDVGPVPVNGQTVVSPAKTTEYTITATGEGGSATAGVTVTVTHPQPTASITVSPEMIMPGETAVLTWNTTHADEVTIEPDIGGTGPSGSATITPGETTTYVISASGPGGSATADVTVTVIEPNEPPTVTITASPPSIPWGGSSTLSWASFNAQNVFIDNGVGKVPAVGSMVISPDHTTTYTITASGSTGSGSAQTTVMVTAAPDPQPAGSFGAQYQDLVPPDATVVEYNPRRFSLIAGSVQAIDSSPIAGVSIHILEHSEYGTVSTDTAGQFTIPVEGGGRLTVAYRKTGFISTHRKVDVPWNDIAIAETVQMIAVDPVATTITFDGNPNTVVTHQSSEVADEFGSRSATIVFSGDNQAFLVDAIGNDVHELTTVTTRATEFTTPNSMPAKLPPNSGYTYCVELSVDGAERVRFEKPVVTWVDNFLGFDVGEIVPVGYYDRDRGVWVPSDNGVVVKLLDTNADGYADALDATGDDQPDDLNSNGTFNDEVTGLNDAVNYPPGSTFWRVAVTHFTPWDCNWPYGPSLDAIPPNPTGIASTDQQRTEEKDCRRNNASFVEERSRIIHEDVPIPGTEMTLHYASNRVEGYKSVIAIPASGETVPPSLQNIIVQLEVAGRKLEQMIDPLPNQKVEFVWDWVDNLGRRVKNSAVAHVAIGFVYQTVYLRPSDFQRSFAQAGRDLTAVRGREDLTIWKRDKIILTNSQRQVTMGEGWTLSTHHFVIPSSVYTLYKGNGTTTSIPAVITTVAGNGEHGYVGSGVLATEVALGDPQGIAVDAVGNLYISEAYYGAIHKVDTDGIITKVVGGGFNGFSGDGNLAIYARINKPRGIEVDASGNLYIADQFNHRIRKVDAAGIINTVAGSWQSGYSGDGGPAISAMLYSPADVAVDTSGNIFIADSYNHCIRKVDNDGIITTVAGIGGWDYYSGDGGPATEASLDSPQSVAVDSSGNIYIADQGNRRIRKVDASGIITTVANGYYVNGIALDTLDNLYISVVGKILKLDTDGILTTVAGTGQRGYSGDGGPAIKAMLDYPYDVAVGASGSFYYVDYYSPRVRKVGFPLITAELNGDGNITFAEGEGLTHILESSGKHKRTNDLATGVVLREFDYDENNNLINVADQFGNQTFINYNNDVPTSIVSPDGLTTLLTIDANNHLTQITYPDGDYFTFEYTSDGLLTAKIEPEGNRFEHNFDNTGRLTDVYDEEGGHWNYNKTVAENGDTTVIVTTGEGNVTTYLDHTESIGAFSSTITDPMGEQTLFSESSYGLNVNKSLPCGMELEFKYDVDSEYLFKYVKEIKESSPAGLEMVTLREKTYEDTDSNDVPDLITETVTVNGKTTIQENDTSQSQITITSPEGRLITTLYDPDTLLVESISNPGLSTTNYGYDIRGRLASVITGSRATTFIYNAQGFLESITDPEDQTTTYTYDPVGRVTGVNRPDGSLLSFAYDNNGNMTVLTNPLDVDHSFGFNTINRSSSYTTPLTGSYSYQYDRDRRLIRTVFPSGTQINTIYDKTRLVQIQMPEGNIDFSYLCGNKVESVTDGSDTITYGYDGKLVISEILSGTLNQALSYTYNNDFSLTGFTYAGDTVNYTYDQDGLLTEAGAYTINRNADSGLPESVVGGGLSTSRTFNGYGELESRTTTVNSQSVALWSLTRDDNGRITQKTETVGGTSSDFIYTYDEIGRLLMVTKGVSLVEEYDYNANGLRIYEMSALRGIAGRSFDYDAEDRLLTVDGTTYQYDADGFLVSKNSGADVTTYNHSSRGELLSASLPDGRTIEYVYGPLGRRVAKKINGAVAEKYLWQGLTRLLAIYDGSNNLIMRFEYADGRMPVAMTRAEGRYYLAYDQVDSLRIVANSAGNVVKLITYDTFGNVITDTNPDFEMPIGFAGGLHDRNTNLVRFGFRDYDPDTGRWTAKDPIFFGGGDVDLYGYTLNDPINSTDPLGLRGGILIPIRTLIKKNATGWDVAARVIGRGLSIPTSGIGFFVAIMAPTDAGVPYEDFLLYKAMNKPLFQLPMPYLQIPIMDDYENLSLEGRSDFCP